MWSEVYKQNLIPVCIGVIPPNWLQEIVGAEPGLVMFKPQLKFNAGRTVVIKPRT
jgi:hypothetical protein